MATLILSGHALNLQVILAQLLLKEFEPLGY
jgi:hypothetical protein